MNDEFVTVCFCPTCDDMIDADWMRIETIPAPAESEGSADGNR